MGGPTFEIADLRLADTSNLLGVDNHTPSISWAYSIPSSPQPWCQQSYVLSLKSWALSDASSGTPTQSYSVAGPKTNQTENIPWPKAFPQLQSSQVYELLVEAVLSNCDRPIHHFDFGTPQGDSLLPPGTSAQTLVTKAGSSITAAVVSSNLRFESGIIGGIDAWRKKAPTLGMITTPWDLEGWETPKAVNVLRNKYIFKSKPKTARIYATAFGLYNILINGKRVGDSIMEPGWTEYSRRVSYQSYNITEYLQQGENTVTVHVADGWYRGRLGPTVKSLHAKRGNFGNETGFMAVMDTFSADGKQQTFWTGSTKETGWKCTKTGPILDSQIYDGEHYDARINLDAVRDQDWKEVKVMPGAFAKPEQVLEASVAPPIRHTESFSVQAKLKTPEGKMILDFGQNIVGRLRMMGKAPSGTKVNFVHVEVLTPNGTPNTEILRDAKATDSYIFNGSAAGIEIWEPEFTYHGFRYAQIDPWIDGLEFEARVYGSDLPKGLMKFKSTNPELDRLVKNIEWSAKGNYFGVPTDCPQRDERLGWTGDINIFAPTGVYIFDGQTFLKSWLRTVEDGQKIGDAHRPPIIAPNVFGPYLSHAPMAIWGDVIITLPWTIYQAYGDTSVLSELWSSIVDYHTNGIPRIPEGQEHEGMWKPAAPGQMYQFGDWLNPAAPPENPQLNATDPYFVADTWLCHTTNTILKIATVLRRPPAEIEEWKSKASRQTSLWQKRYLFPLNRFTNNETSQLIKEDSQTAYSLALNFNLLPEEYIQPAIARLHHLVRKENYHPTTGLTGTAELLNAVTYPRLLSSSSSEAKLKSVNLAYKLLLGRRDIPSWLYPITMGATSMWERWDSVKPDGSTNAPWMTSLNHYALGAPGNWIFQTVGGIRMEYDDGVSTSRRRGWSKFVFDPVPNLEHGVTEAEMVYSSPKGLVECKWSYDKGTKMVKIEVALPGNCEGEIKVLGKTEKTVGAGRWSVNCKVGDDESKLLEAGEGEQQISGKL